MATPARPETATEEGVEAGYNTLEEFQTRWSEAQTHLSEGRFDQGHAVVQKFFPARARFYGEKHVRLARFINPLLEAYCLALQDDLAPKRSSDRLLRVDRRIRFRQSFINDFLEFCLAKKRYEELEVLLQEMSTGFRETRADSPNKDFWVWCQMETGAQSQLAQLHVPGSSYYWEDSRTYTKTWGALKLEATRITDPMPELPIAVTVRPEGIEYGDAMQKAKLQGSEILALLERKRQASEWEILAAWDQQIWQRKLKDLARAPGPHKIWIFPADIVPDKGVDDEDEYGFVHLGGDHSEWLAVRLGGRSKRPNEPRKRETPDEIPYDQRFRSFANRPSLRQNEANSRHKYSIEETGAFAIEVTAPFLPLQEFERSAAHIAGLTYAEYMAVLTDAMGHGLYFADHRLKICREVSPNQRSSITLDQRSAETFEPGFLGKIPTGLVFSWRKAEGAEKVNVVSSRWHDWKDLPLEQEPSHVQLPGGHEVPCLGSVVGTWAFEEEVDVYWKNVRFFVVDVDLKTSSCSEINFVIDKRSMAPEQLNTMTSPELRSFAAGISLGLFRFARAEVSYLGAKFKAFAQVSATAAMSEDNRQWEETNRRDKWDRSHDKRLRACKRLADSKAVMDNLNVEYEEEHARRRAWDEDGGVSASMNSLALSSSSAASLKATS